MTARLDLTGQRYGRLLVIGPGESRPNGRPYCTCRCDCGTVKDVVAYDLRNGKTTSCGCRLAEASAARAYRHGGCIDGRRGPELGIWTQMHNRCERPGVSGYDRYGGRGIKVCERWASFSAFLADMGPRPSPKHTLDRVDNDGPYSPENCRWATRWEQANNTRRTRRFTFDGVTRTLPEWAKLTGIPGHIVTARVDRRGWPVERALTQPVTRRRSKV
jgi:hypothetical protein